jgi:hypothetical protein
LVGVALSWVSSRPLADDGRAAGALRDREAASGAAHVDLGLVGGRAAVDALGRLEGRADQPPPHGPREPAQVLAEHDPGERAVVLDVDVRRVRGPAVGQRDDLRRDGERDPGQPPRPHARHAGARDVTPRDDRVALRRDADLGLEIAGAGRQRRIDVDGLWDERPRGILQARGVHVAALLPDDVGGAVDAEVDVDAVRVRPAELDRADPRPRRGAPALDDVGVHVAAGDPGDRDPVVVADRDLDLGGLEGDRVHALRAAPGAAVEPLHEGVRHPAVPAQIGDGAGAVTRDIDIADGDHVGVRAVDRDGRDPVRPRGRGKREQDDQQCEKTA